jgi:hypothetical protein
MKTTQLPFSAFAFLVTLLLSSLSISAQSMTEEEALKVFFGDPGKVASSYTFADVMTYSMVMRSAVSDSAIVGSLRVLYNEGDSAFGIELTVDSTKSVTLCDVSNHAVVMLITMGNLRLGQYLDYPNSSSTDSLKFGRVSGDREIGGRMSNHFFLEDRHSIMELWSDKEASEEEVRMGRLWPAFMANMTALAIGNHWGLPTRLTSTDTRKGELPQLEIELKMIAALENPETITVTDYTFPRTPRDEIIERIEQERSEREKE